MNILNIHRDDTENKNIEKEQKLLFYNLVM